MPRQKRSLSDTIGHLFRRFFDLDEPKSEMTPSTIWTTTSNTGEGEVEVGGVVKPLTTTNLKTHSTKSKAKATHSHTRSNSHKLTKSAPTTYTGTTAVSVSVAKANAVYIHRSPSNSKGGDKEEGKGGVKEGVKVKSVGIVPKIGGGNTTSNSNGNSNSNSNSTAALPGQAQDRGNVTVGVGGLGVSASSSGSSAAAVLTAANTSFELTPLSGLIKQSYKDIGTLRAIQAERERVIRMGGGVGDAGGIGGGGEKVDFDGMEEHLRRFEEVYRQFLRYGGRHGDSQEEVHLVAILCKRSDVLSSTSNTSSKRNSKNGGSGSGNESEKEKKVREKDCGF